MWSAVAGSKATVTKTMNELRSWLKKTIPAEDRLQRLTSSVFQAASTRKLDSRPLQGSRHEQGATNAWTPLAVQSDCQPTKVVFFSKHSQPARFLHGLSNHFGSAAEFYYVEVDSDYMDRPKAQKIIAHFGLNESRPWMAMPGSGLIDSSLKFPRAYVCCADFSIFRELQPPYAFTPLRKQLRAALSSTPQSFISRSITKWFALFFLPLNTLVSVFEAGMHALEQECVRRGVAVQRFVQSVVLSSTVLFISAVVLFSRRRAAALRAENERRRRTEQDQFNLLLNLIRGDITGFIAASEHLKKQHQIRDVTPLLRPQVLRPEDAKTDKSCPICQEDFVTADSHVKAVCYVPCGNWHLFHHECISVWGQRSSLCPLCRGPFTEESLLRQDPCWRLKECLATMGGFCVRAAQWFKKNGLGVTLVWLSFTAGVAVAVAW